MSTSGVNTFSIDRDDLIQMALQHIGAIGEGDTPSSTQLSEINLYLNMLVKSRQKDGMQLWAKKQGYILPQTATIGSGNTTGISIGSSGGHITTSYTNTTTTVDAVSSATTITVASVIGIANTYNIGIELDDGTIQWTTVNGAPSGLVVTLTAALTGDASSGSQVYCYQTKISRPLRILDGYSILTSSATRNPINIIERTSYFNLGNPTTTGTVNQLYYDPQLDNGIIYLYPEFSGTDQVIEFTYLRPFDDFVNATDTPDFPQEWYLPIMLELASLIGPKYGIQLEERLVLMKEAKMYRDEILEMGGEEGSLYVQPDSRR